MKINNFVFTLQQRGYEISDIDLILQGVFNSSYSESFIKDIDLDSNKVEYVFNMLDKKYPPSYLAGFVNIRGIKIFVNENVLIPRTETIEFMYNEIKNNYDLNNKRVLDLCTGSGVISILLKKLFPNAIIDASDISINALNIAKKSIEYNNLNINLIQSDYFSNINKKYDYIISNPPYIEENSLDVNAPFEPEIALYSGKDGLDSYRNIFASLNEHLTDNGIAFFEIETSNYSNLLKLINSQIPSYKVKTYKDLENKERYLILGK